MAAPRIYVIPAREAETAIVIRRGPTRWWHLLHWDLAKQRLEPGAWFHGNIYPRRCGLSPNGKYFGYFALKSTAEKGWPEAYFAVSRAPWMKALVAWETIGTWTGGCRFATDRHLVIEAAIHPEPFHGKFPHRVTLQGLNTDWPRRAVANEIDRGWELWERDEDPRLVDLPLADLPVLALSRRAKGKLGPELALAHRGVDFKKPGMEGVQIRYFLREESGAKWRPLHGVQWADWDRHGQLLLARRDGCLQVARVAKEKLEPVWEQSLCELTPDPKPAPGYALQW